MKKAIKTLLSLTGVFMLTACGGGKETIYKDFYAAKVVANSIKNNTGMNDYMTMQRTFTLDRTHSSIISGVSETSEIIHADVTIDLVNDRPAAKLVYSRDYDYVDKVNPSDSYSTDSTVTAYLLFDSNYGIALYGECDDEKVIEPFVSNETLIDNMRTFDSTYDFSYEMGREPTFDDYIKFSITQVLAFYILNTSSFICGQLSLFSGTSESSISDEIVTASYKTNIEKRNLEYNIVYDLTEEEGTTPEPGTTRFSYAGVYKNGKLVENEYSRDFAGTLKISETESAAETENYHEKVVVKDFEGFEIPDFFGYKVIFM